MKITLSKKLILLSLLLIGFSFASYHIVKTIKRKSILKSFFQEERWQQMRKDFSKIKKTKHTTIFFGDSMTENFEPYVPNSDSVSNMGIGGDFTEGLLKRIDNVTNSCPDKVFIMIGINDLVEKVPLSEIEDNYISLMETIQQSCPQTTIYIQSTLPTRGLNSLMSSSRDINKRVIQLNSFLKTATAQRKITFIDFYAAFADNDNLLKAELTVDGIHLTGKGNEMWRDFLKGYL